MSKLDMNKGLIVVLGLVLLGGIFYALSLNKRTSTNLSPSTLVSPTPTTATADTSVADAIKGFYANYDDCMKNPPAEAKGIVGTYCQSHNLFITGTFVKNLEQGGIAKAGADPIVCAQDFPTGFSVGAVMQEGDKGKGEVTESFGEVVKVKTTVNLLKEANGWKVDNIICPKP